MSSKGKYALMFDIALAFDGFAAKNGPLGSEFDKLLVDMDQRWDKHVEDDKAKYNHISRAMPRRQTLRSSPEGWFNSRIFSRTETAASLRKHLGTNDAVLRPSDNARSSSTEHQELLVEDDFICEFYNVLWIERKDGIAYRGACGWVPKHIWEAHATGPEEIKLG
jgi:hypothetical protein